MPNVPTRDPYVTILKVLPKAGLKPLMRIKDEYMAAALEWLAKAKAGGYFNTDTMKHTDADRDLDSLRAHPAFQQFMAEVKASLPFK